MSGLDISDAAS